jgi:glycosyltransferase involved in cell wall biosynthesis
VRKAKPREAVDKIGRRSKSDQLLLSARFHKFNGYGDFARQLTRELIDLVPIAIQTTPEFHDQLKAKDWLQYVCDTEPHPGGEVSIQPTFSEMLPPKGDRAAMYTMFECDRLLPAWRARMNEFDLVIVPSNENAMHFRRQTTTKIVSVPLGIEFEHYHWKPFKERDVFTFGTAGHLGHGSTRKGLFRVIEWFQDAFPKFVKDVRLSVKLNRGHDNLDTFGDSRIELVPSDMSTEQLADWHHSIDVYADGSTFEGWGMFPCNSIASGRPVIGTYYGGHREYFRFGNHVSIGYNVELADDIYAQTGGAWAVPDHSDGVEAMRWCYDNQADVKQMGQRAAKSVLHLTWKNTALGVLDALSRHGVIE